MAPESFLHNDKNFPDLIRIVGQEMSIDPALVEKDYWIMHCLFGLQKLGMKYELKGGTSLSKGYRLIYRFSEDIDIQIEPPGSLAVKTGKNQNKPAQCESRRRFYDWLAQTIKIDGIVNIKRDTGFDSHTFHSGGIRLHYNTTTGPIKGLKEGVLLEAGFDDVTPNFPKDISSWAYDYAADKIAIHDNRAKAVNCYDPGYTLVEKLQTISTKFRKQQETDTFPANFMRHYYDVYCLLQDPSVQTFVGTDAYYTHKERRFRSGDERNISKNEAFLLNDPGTREQYEKAYLRTGSLYYKTQPPFSDIINLVTKHIATL